MILLEVDNPNSVIDTIRSRVIDLSNSRLTTLLSPAGQDIVRYYREGKYTELASLLYSMRPMSDEAILILR